MGICADKGPNDEKKIRDAIGTINYDIINKTSKSICKLFNKETKEYATGFFMDIYPTFKCLLTNYKVITQNMIDSNSIIEISNDSGVKGEIKLNKNERYIKCFEKYDITIIQIKQLDKFNKYFDSLQPDMNYKILPKQIIPDIKDIFSLHYQQPEKIATSVGKIIKISHFEFIHSLSTGNGSLGCPIILSSSSKVLGINKLGKNIADNYGTFIGVIYEEINKDISKGLINININLPEHNFICQSNNSQNIITAKIYINNENINKDVLIINSSEEFLRREQSNNENELKNEMEIKDCEITIDDKLINFSYTFNFKEVGEHTIIYKFRNKLKNLSNIFSGCSLLTNIDLSNFDAENVEYMGWMFYECSSLNSIDFSNFDTGNAIDMRFMFGFCSSLTKLDLSDFNTEKVIDMRCMFTFCTSLRNLDLTNFNTKNVFNMSMMFCNCCSLEDLNITNMNTQNVTNMELMFSQCSKLKQLNLSSFDTKNVKTMKGMFFLCDSLTDLDLSHFDTRKVTNMNQMFCGCVMLKNLDVSNFDIQNVKDLNQIFYACSSLRKDKLNKLKSYAFNLFGKQKNNGENPYNKITQNNPKQNNQRQSNKFNGKNPNNIGINNEKNKDVLNMSDMFIQLGINEDKFLKMLLMNSLSRDMSHIQRHQTEFNLIPNIISVLYSKGKIDDNIMMNPSSWINYEKLPGSINPRFLEQILIKKKELKSGVTKFILIFPPPKVGTECFFAILYFDEFKRPDYFTLELEFGNDFGTQNGTGLVCGQKEFQHLNYYTICKANLEDFENIVRKLYPEY